MNPEVDDTSPFALRRAVPADVVSAAKLYVASREASVPAIPPINRPPGDVGKWLGDFVIPQLETWLAEEQGELVAIMVLDGNELDQLYVGPNHQGRGLGTLMVQLAQSLRPDGLELWTFESNLGAQRFYERHGFVALYRTDGSENAEKAPDIRYAWQPPSPD